MLPVTKKVPQIKMTTEWRLEAAFQEISNLCILLFQVQHRLSKHLIGAVGGIHFMQLGYLYNTQQSSDYTRFFKKPSDSGLNIVKSMQDNTNTNTIQIKFILRQGS